MFMARILIICSNKMCTHVMFYPKQVGYEPAGLTVHPPQNDRGWVHFFGMGV